MDALAYAYRMNELVPFVVPSWIIPGTISENAAFLRGKSRGVMLCAFESCPALPSVLPKDDMGMEWHMHLPLDLPWESGGRSASKAACAVMREAGSLVSAQSRAILHIPPGKSIPLLADFIRGWQAEGLSTKCLVLENEIATTRRILYSILEAFTDIRLCLDLAHLVLSDGNGATRWTQEAVFGDFLNKVDMVHWSAPLGCKDAHAPLTKLEDEHRPFYEHVARLTDRGSVIDVIEVFDWQGALSSAPVLGAWRTARSDTD